jgi:hypothetical protein
MAENSRHDLSTIYPRFYHPGMWPDNTEELMELTKASSEWMKRPPEERFTSLHDMHNVAKTYRGEAITRVVANRDIKAAPIDGEPNGLALVIGGVPARPSHHAFNQMASLVGAPSGYLRTLPAPMVADCLNYGLFSQRRVQEIGTLVHTPPTTTGTMMAATGPNFGRVWNDDVIAALIERFGDGITGDFTVPGEFGRAVTVDKGNTTLYRSDRDMFVFLADEKNRITIPNRRNGRSGSLARGFFLWNSEVGAATLGISTFLFDYACSNRIVWGATEHKEVRLRHTSGAPHRWIEEIAPALEIYAQSSAASITEAITKAQAARLGDEDAVNDFLSRRFTFAQASAIKLAHMTEEDRPVETIWDAVTAITAYAKRDKYQASRIEIEREAGKVLDLAS